MQGLFCGENWRDFIISLPGEGGGVMNKKQNKKKHFLKIVVISVVHRGLYGPSPGSPNQYF